MQRLEAPPRPEDGVCALRAADVRRILEREFGVTMGRQAVYDLLPRLGYSDLMPRPHHEDANPEVQEFFKEIVVDQIDAIAVMCSTTICLKNSWASGCASGCCGRGIRSL